MSSKLGFVVLLIGLAALSRLIPHPPNFTPVIAMALFGGAVIADRKLALLVPLLALLVSDLLIGLHDTMLFVYGGVALITMLGFVLHKRRSFGRVFGYALAASVLFFTITNLGVWLKGGLYPLTVEGLVACYVAAIPFFHNTLVATLLYTALLFGADLLWRRRLAYSS